ncbi:MAG: heparan-alpha-glucosaminide N-acetyltransferase domain-containing protein [Actinomycetia bacterium]|nr:heparan-alpha-glucosaminide N-acetyltransferase domain-containing protein [Actinomycetes bacterium]
MATLDVLRGVAIVCMLIAHGMPFFWGTGVPAPVAEVTQAINDVASPLFGLVMGGAAALVWSRASVRGHWPRRVLIDIGRGVLIFAFGVLLVELETWVAVVLQVLGVLLILGIPVAALAGVSMRPQAAARLPSRVALVAVTAGLFVLAPWVTGALVPAEERLYNGTTGGTAEIWAALMAGTSYRAVSLLPFFALGALLAASGLAREPRRLAALAAPTAAVLLAATLLGAGGPIELSGDPADQLRDLVLVVTAVALVGAIVGFGGAAVEPGWRMLADLGAIALSLYALQLIVLRPLQEVGLWQDSVAWGWVAMITLVLVPCLLMLLWRRVLGAGPLERLVALVTGRRAAS